jgi:hypothetical protein
MKNKKQWSEHCVVHSSSVRITVASMIVAVPIATMVAHVAHTMVALGVIRVPALKSQTN